jgi:hypothetical protein
MARSPKVIPLAALATPSSSGARTRTVPVPRPAPAVEPTPAESTPPPSSVTEPVAPALPPVVLRILDAHPARAVTSNRTSRWKQGLQLIDERRKMLVGVTIGITVLSMLIWRGGGRTNPPSPPAAKPETILEWSAPQTSAFPPVTTPAAPTFTTTAPNLPPDYRTADRGANLAEQARQASGTPSPAPVRFQGTIEKQPFDTSYERPRSSPN